MHGDVLYLLEPENLPSVTEEDLKRLVRLGLVSICYDQLDHAEVIFRTPGTRDYCMSLVGEDPVIAIEEYSRLLAGRMRMQRLLSRFHLD